ncbi:Pyridoxal phosphate-dependent transferase [Pseudocohnilembus persalinus]|uniref:Pyridoxal phosphate-dependent transferase n=1 Tax=Pseudocohnilembus persalinus TaxID=266149 RepID=A0A0V0Q874_PSEPJ|nr:Pyridoxal phosphate-dependent transferase [Pseudocohnilembus persalinus]|eukprot:KRW98247.1 Pyridoxal phosphate-dependent transferase [Pseudocohnilembus persalinus]
MSNRVAKDFEILPYSALVLDIQYKQILQAMLQLVHSNDRAELIKGIEQLMVKDPQQERLLVTLSVRTALDLALQSLDLPPGSEIIVTAVNIPDMMTVFRYHGLIPVPVEIDAKTLSPKLEDIKQAYKPGKTTGLMVSYLYGAKFDSTEIFKWAKQQQLIVLEDEAESFDGPQRNGNPLADLTFFSFGSIKPATSFGGAITILRNNEVLYRKMKAIQDKYDFVPRSKFLKKCLINMGVILGTNTRFSGPLYKIITPLIDNGLVQIDYREYFVSKIRGFQTTQQRFLEAFRYQMPTPMIYLLLMRLSQFDYQELQQNTNKLNFAQQQLIDYGLEVPGILTSDPYLFYKIIISRGAVGTYLGATQLKVVPSPLGHSYKYPQKTEEFFKQIVYLPIHKDVPQSGIEKIIKQAVETEKIVKNLKSRKLADYPKL